MGANLTVSAGCVGRNVTSSCVYSCDTGFAFASGGSGQACESSAAWTQPTAPECVPASGWCSPLSPAPPLTGPTCNGTFLEVCRGVYACPAGQNVVGNTSPQCGISGGWGPTPVAFCSATTGSNSAVVSPVAVTVSADHPWVFDVIPRTATNATTGHGADVITVQGVGPSAGASLEVGSVAWFADNGTMRVRVPVTVAPASWTVRVLINGETIETPPVPLEVTVVPGAVDASRCVASGLGLGSTDTETLYAGTAGVSFVVSPRDAHDNPRTPEASEMDTVTAAMRSSMGEEVWADNATALSTDPLGFMFTYTAPPESGLYSIEVRVGGVEVANSPFLVAVGAVCGAGEYAEDFVGPCVACQVGTFSDADLNTECTGCPEHTSTEGTGASGAANCTCVAGYYSAGGVPGVACEACPNGGACLGGQSPPHALPGFYRIREDRFARCPRQESCLGGGAGCARGYAGMLCAKCEAGFYRVNSQCHYCDQGRAWVFVVLALLVTWVACGALLWFNTREGGVPGGAAVTIVLTSLQIGALYSQIDLDWPAVAENVFDVISVASLNVQIFAPECSFAGNPYIMRVIITLLLPVIAGALLLTTLGCALAIRKWVVTNSAQTPRSLARAAAKSYMHLMLFFYLPLTAICLQFFDCTSVEGSTERVVSSAPEQTCHDAGYWQALGPVLLGAVVYCIGVPGVMFYLLWTWKRKMEWTVLSLRMSFLVGRYNASAYWYEVAVLLRKLGVVLGVTLFQTPLNEATLVFFVLTGAAVHLAVTYPYRERRHSTLDVVCIASALAVLAGGLGAGVWKDVLVMAALAVFLGISVAGIAIDVVAFLRDRREAQEDWGQDDEIFGFAGQPTGGSLVEMDTMDSQGAFSNVVVSDFGSAVSCDASSRATSSCTTMPSLPSLPGAGGMQSVEPNMGVPLPPPTPGDHYLASFEGTTLY